MKITSEIEDILRREADNIQEVELTYLNGGIARGSIKRLKTDPLDLIIRKQSENRRGGSKHHAVFDHVTRIVLTMKDNTVLEWKDIK